MTLHRTQLVSAVVVMRPSSGDRLPADAAVTADTLARFAPATADVNAARSWFERAGFRSGTLVGISFSIEGGVGLFEDCFDTQLVETAAGGVARRDPAAEAGTALELPLDALPRSLLRTLEAVTFSDPPDFGPGGSFF